jgi:uncharacterized damage-inducible protein DinB
VRPWRERLVWLTFILMPLPDSLVIGPTPGYSPALGRLVAMMGFARMTTFRAADGLTMAQLDHLHDASSNSIGALLAHVAAVEVAYQRITFEGRGLSLPAYDEEWMTALQLGEAGRERLRGKPLAHYVSGLERVREFTLKELARRNDKWLDETDVWNGRQVNNYFKWFHVFEDELNHRGQIRWLRQRLPAA